MVILDLVERVGALPVGATVEVPLAPGDADLVRRWCERTGNELVGIGPDTATVRRGRARDPVEDLPRDRRPGARLWLYTNFDCNLACDYCCARSSPRTPRRALGLDRVRRIIAEAAELTEVTEVFLTGGEPFLLPDLDQIVRACTDRFPTTLLTNGMLFRGRRLDLLRSMPRDRLTLQISLDSPAPDRHDRHRGQGSWNRAVAGIRIALDEGFRVRVAATIAPGEDSDADAFHAYLDTLGIPLQDRVVRPVAQRGSAADGVALTVDSLIPEVTVTDDGVYWHPVGADHLDQLVTRDIFPLSAAVEEIRRRFVEYRSSANTAAESFPCA
ncbi:radical SAM protein [Nonomuraea sp. NPDC059194]|uniref:Rv1681 family radical SAM protein n=1 Tax=Nonomuraea sp. NPDC059194 TaxID=3346764 RepID=UPI0036CDE8B5